MSSKPFLPAPTGPIHLPLDPGAQPSTLSSSKRRRTLLLLTLGSTISALLLLLLFLLQPSKPSSDTSPKRPSPVDWHACPEEPDNSRFSCATVEVPLDYRRGYEGGSAFVAVSKYAAPEVEGGKKAKALFMNPGGPGGSGYLHTFRAAPSLSKIMPSGYDFIGWDPRGIGKTTPLMRCFETMKEETIYLRDRASDPEVKEEKEVYYEQVRKVDRENKEMVERCERVVGREGRFMGTTTVVRDLELLATLIEGEEAEINFFGWSYGTLVGAYLTAMYPSRVGHVVLDGVVDAWNWVNNPQHEVARNSHSDTDKTFYAFLDACITAGPSRCALATANATVASIAKDVDDLLERTLAHPLVVERADDVEVLVYPAMIKNYIFLQLYRPVELWTGFAESLAEALNGNGARIYENRCIKIEDDATKPGDTLMSTTAVMCSDAPAYLTNLTSSDLVPMLAEEQIYQSQHTSKYVSGLLVPACPHWGRMRQPDRFTGPFYVPTANPIILIGNTADPITAMKNAKAFSDRLGTNHSRFIHHDGFGHLSSAMPSLCTIKAIQAYFMDSILPPNNLFCKTDFELFSNVEESSRHSAMSVEDRELLDAAAELGWTLEGAGKWVLA